MVQKTLEIRWEDGEVAGRKRVREGRTRLSG
jgi:hypothetical protein